MQITGLEMSCYLKWRSLSRSGSYAGEAERGTDGVDAMTHKYKSCQVTDWSLFRPSSVVMAMCSAQKNKTDRN